MSDPPKSPARRYEEQLAIQPLEPIFNDDGVDLTQIREMLAMTPLERLRYVDQAATSIEEMLAMARVVVCGAGEE